MGGFSSRNKSPEETINLVEKKKKNGRHKGRKECESPEETINLVEKKKKKWRHKGRKECERRIAELEQQNKELRDENMSRIEELEKLKKELCDEKMSRIEELEKLKKELCDEKKIKEDLGKKYHKLYIAVRRAMGVEVTLDEDTMNPYLRVSEDGRELRWTEHRQTLRDTPKRFDEYPCVLGNRLPVEMRRGCYWEVEVGNKKSWELGVARGSVSRKGQLSLSPGAGFWVLSLWDGKLTALTDPETPLDTDVLTRVGIHVDYEEKAVSFYNVQQCSLLYTFENKIDGDVRPFFSPGNNDNEPLCITNCTAEDIKMNLEI